MALETFLKGSSLLKSITFTTDGVDELGNATVTPIPHDDINGVRVVMASRGTVLHKWSSIPADVTAGWIELTVEPEPGTFTFSLTPAQTKELPTGPLRIEVSRTFDTDGMDDFVNVSAHDLCNVVSTLTQTLNG